MVLLVGTEPLRVLGSLEAPAVAQEACVASGFLWVADEGGAVGVALDGSGDTSLSLGDTSLPLLASDGKALWLLSRESGALYRWFEGELAEVARPPVPPSPYLMTTLGDGLVVFGEGGGVVLGPLGDSLGYVPLDERASDALALDPERVAAYVPRGVRVWSLEVGDLGALDNDTLVGPRGLLALSEDGGLLYASSSQGFRVWDAGSLDQLGYVRTPRLAGGPIAEIPGGLLVYVGNVMYQYGFAQ